MPYEHFVTNEGYFQGAWKQWKFYWVTEEEITQDEANEYLKEVMDVEDVAYDEVWYLYAGPDENSPSQVLNTYIKREEVTTRKFWDISYDPEVEAETAEKVQDRLEDFTQ